MAKVSLSDSEYLEQLQQNQSLPEKIHSWKSDRNGISGSHNWKKKKSPQESVAGLMAFLGSGNQIGFFLNSCVMVKAAGSPMTRAGGVAASLTTP